MPPGMALIVTLRGSNYCYLEQIFMVPKGFEPSVRLYDCIANMKAVQHFPKNTKKQKEEEPQ